MDLSRSAALTISSAAFCVLIVRVASQRLYPPLSTSFDAMPSENVGKKIGFIGAGNMAEALAQGFIAKKKITAKDIWATDISQERKKVFKDFGANATDSSSEASSHLLLVPLGQYKFYCCCANPVVLIKLIRRNLDACRSSKTPILFSSLSSHSMSLW